MTAPPAAHIGVAAQRLRDRTPQKDAFCAMPVEKKAGPLEMTRCQEPDAASRPPLPVPRPQPVIDVVAKHGARHGEPQQITEVEIAAGRKRTQ